MKHVKLSIILTVLILSIAGCSTSPVCVTSSVTPMSGKTVSENMGRCEGSDTAWSFLGLFMIGRPDLDVAIKDALARSGGDTLVNVRCYETSRYFFLFSLTTVTVEGEAVKFSPDEVPVKGRVK